MLLGIILLIVFIIYFINSNDSSNNKDLSEIAMIADIGSTVYIFIFMTLFIIYGRLTLRIVFISAKTVESMSIQTASPSLSPVQNAANAQYFENKEILRRLAICLIIFVAYLFIKIIAALVFLNLTLNESFVFVVCYLLK